MFHVKRSESGAQSMPTVDVDDAWLQATREPLAAFHEILAGEGVKRGVIGPREHDRLWSRHLLNCAAVADPSLGLVPPTATVIDVGTGGGLPGLVWALIRPDIEMVLVEPLQRRIAFLSEAVAQLDIVDRVMLQPVRAQEYQGPAGDVVTSRALSSLDDIAQWSLPLLKPTGSIVAMKGARADAELAQARESIQRMGIKSARVVRIGPLQPDGHPWASVVVMREQGA